MASVTGAELCSYKLNEIFMKDELKTVIVQTFK